MQFLYVFRVRAVSEDKEEHQRIYSFFFFLIKVSVMNKAIVMTSGGNLFTFVVCVLINTIVHGNHC